MILKDDELMIIGLINENKVAGHITLKEVKYVFYDIIQVGPMFNTFLEFLEKQGTVEPNCSLTAVSMSYQEVF